MYGSTFEYLKQLTVGKKEAGIYGLFCEANKSVYIGASVELRKRFSRHRSHLKKNKHCNIILQNVFNKYGIDTFQFLVLEMFEDITAKNILDRETHWIQKYRNTNSNYNCLNLEAPVNTWNKDQNFINRKRKKLHQTQGIKPSRAYTQTEEYRNRQSEILKGRKCTWQKQLKEARHKRTLKVYSMIYTLQDPNNIIHKIYTWSALKNFLKSYNIDYKIPFHKRISIEKLVREKESKGFTILEINRINENTKQMTTIYKQGELK